VSYSNVGDDDDVLAILLAVRHALKLKKTRSKKKAPRFWVNEYLKERRVKGRFAVDVRYLICYSNYK